MTCELNDETCEWCEEPYCPDQIEENRLTYQRMLLKLSDLREELNAQDVAVADFYEEHKSIL